MIDDQTLVSNMPLVFQKMIAVAENVLKETTHEESCTRKVDT